MSGGATARLASVLLVVGLLLAPIAPIPELVGWLAPLPLLAPQAAHVVGLAALSIGFALTAISQSQMGAPWRIDVSRSERTSLTDGIVSHVRNPIFTGMLLALAGLLLAASDKPPRELSAAAGFESCSFLASASAAAANPSQRRR